MEPQQMLDDDARGLLRALLYTVQFADDPAARADHAIEEIIGRRAYEDVTASDYAAAIRRALASDEPLAELIPQNHPEERVRRFFAAVEHKLNASPD